MRKQFKLSVEDAAKAFVMVVLRKKLRDRIKLALKIIFKKL